MANRRNLKRDINYICSELFAECIAASLYGGNDKQVNCDVVLSSILRIHSDFIRRVSCVEPGMKPRIYFKHLKDDFNSQVSDIVDNIRNLG